jgi:hypothetical protein
VALNIAQSDILLLKGLEVETKTRFVIIAGRREYRVECVARKSVKPPHILKIEKGLVSF